MIRRISSILLCLRRFNKCHLAIVQDVARVCLSLSLSLSLPLPPSPTLQPVNPCSVKFPLHSYTIAAGDAVTHVVDAEMVIPDPDRRVRLKLVLSGVALDNSYNLTVTACNAITSNNITGCPTGITLIFLPSVNDRMAVGGYGDYTALAMKSYKLLIYSKGILFSDQFKC